MSCFNIGDKVHWTHTVHRGRSIEMTTRHGVVTGESSIGGCCVVKFRSKPLVINASRLRKEGTQTELTDIIKEGSHD